MSCSDNFALQHYVSNKKKKKLQNNIHIGYQTHSHVYHFMEFVSSCRPLSPPPRARLRQWMKSSLGKIACNAGGKSRHWSRTWSVMYVHPVLCIIHTRPTRLTRYCSGCKIPGLPLICWRC